MEHNTLPSTRFTVAQDITLCNLVRCPGRTTVRNFMDAFGSDRGLELWQLFMQVLLENSRSQVAKQEIRTSMWLASGVEEVK